MSMQMMGITLKNGRLSYSFDNRYNEKQIKYITFDDQGQPDKRLELNMDKNFNFSLYKYAIPDLKEFKQLEELEVNITKTSPMYKPLENFLYGNESFLIDDDKTEDINKKAMKIAKDDENIKIIFRNEKENDNNIQNKFSVFIENVKYDEKSKLDKDGLGTNNTKAKLAVLFDQLGKSIIEQRQISIGKKQERQR